jgi:hypothetical protein
MIFLFNVILPRQFDSQGQQSHFLSQFFKQRRLSYLSCVPQAGAGSFAPQAGAGSFAPQAGAGSFVPQAGAGSFVPHAQEMNSFAVI